MAFAWKSTKTLVVLAGLKADRIQDIQSTENCHQEDGLFFVSNDPFHPPSYLKLPALHWSNLAEQDLKTNVDEVIDLFEYTAMGIIQS
jgi:recombinational DNA repair protein RecR